MIESVDLPAIETDRLILEPCGVADLDVIHAIWTDRAVRRFLWDDVAVSREWAENLMAHSMAQAEIGLGLWKIVLRPERAVAGFCGLRTCPDSPGEVEMLIGLLPRHWCKGIATRACRALLRYSFAHRHRIHARTDPRNLAAVRLMLRLGMTFDQEVRFGEVAAHSYSVSRRKFREAARSAKADQALTV